jgi:Zn-dependent peptidase ImmA (M78 family)/DNA-binding XRE family transcriptional regulator
LDTQLIASNLLRLRKDRGKSQEEVADRAGLSRAAYRSIEKARAEPRPESLRAIAAALGAPLRELVRPAPQLERVRFRSLKRLKSRDQILVEVGRWLRAFQELEELLGAHQPHALAPLWRRLSGSRTDDLAAAAAVAREHFGLGPREPIHDICGLLEARGVKVRPVVVANDAFLGLSVAEDAGGPAVVVNTWERLAVEHWIYSAAHELGHLLLHLGAYDVSVEDEDEHQEREAEVFASHFLMPDDAFWNEWNDAAGLGLYDRVLKVKRVFRVSWRVVVYRVSERLPQGERSRLWRQMASEHQRRHRRPLLKLTEPSGVPEHVFREPRRIAGAGAEPAALDAHDFQGDRLARLVRRAVEAEEISLARGAEILGLGVSEMRDLAASWVA